ncbi:hypothetical protein BGW38_005338 [Lunasporangiospora selenospora]|uniref:Uncharacterized protein n=1 Tax=Lunasporangiospora selenospora TaxID=979761 RepID=A0A9P6KBF9_9FUNG|nr:hypothetical protein BGW38_005338 [Lunasporangiospora selenospora]
MTTWRRPETWYSCDYNSHTEEDDIKATDTVPSRHAPALPLSAAAAPERRGSWLKNIGRKLSSRTKSALSLRSKPSREMIPISTRGHNSNGECNCGMVHVWASEMETVKEITPDSDSAAVVKHASLVPELATITASQRGTVEHQPELLSNSSSCSTQQPLHSHQQRPVERQSQLLEVSPTAASPRRNGRHLFEGQEIPDDYNNNGSKRKSLFMSIMNPLKRLSLVGSIDSTNDNTSTGTTHDPKNAMSNAQALRYYSRTNQQKRPLIKSGLSRQSWRVSLMKTVKGDSFGPYYAEAVEEDDSSQNGLTSSIPSEPYRDSSDEDYREETHEDVYSDLNGPYAPRQQSSLMLEYVPECLPQLREESDSNAEADALQRASVDQDSYEEDQDAETQHDKALKMSLDKLQGLRVRQLQQQPPRPKSGASLASFLRYSLEKSHRASISTSSVVGGNHLSNRSSRLTISQIGNTPSVRSSVMSVSDPTMRSASPSGSPPSLFAKSHSRLRPLEHKDSVESLSEEKWPYNEQSESMSRYSSCSDRTVSSAASSMDTSSFVRTAPSTHTPAPVTPRHRRQPPAWINRTAPSGLELPRAGSRPQAKIPARSSSILHPSKTRWQLDAVSERGMTESATTYKETGYQEPLTAKCVYRDPNGGRPGAEAGYKYNDDFNDTDNDIYTNGWRDSSSTDGRYSGYDQDKHRRSDLRLMESVAFFPPASRTVLVITTEEVVF